VLPVALGVTNLRGTPLAPPEDRMPETPHADVETTEAPVAEPAEDLVEEESLVEEVSIDGMCGVY
jgi:mycofactocin precursor